MNCSNELPLSADSEIIAAQNNFDVKFYQFEAAIEELRKPRVVKIGAIQNSIVLPTTDSIQKQRDAIFEKIGKLIDAAGANDVNVLCLQEAWSEKSISKCSIVSTFNLVFSYAIRFLHER